MDGEALSEGQLHEATMKAPHIHWAKAHIDTHPVEDQQRVEFAHQANAFVGTFVVKVFTFLCFCLHSFTFALQVFTKLRETKVVEQFTAVPEDGQVFEKTKRRICCALPQDAEGGGSGSGGKVVRRFDNPESGLVETGLPVVTLEVSYDDLVGTRARHWGQREFQVPKLREAGVGQNIAQQLNLTSVTRFLKRCCAKLSQMGFQGKVGTRVLQLTLQRRKRRRRGSSWRSSKRSRLELQNKRAAMATNSDEMSNKY